MPDWISHILIALIICEIFKIKKKSLVVLGSLLPDMLGKLSLLNLFTKVPEGFFFWITVPFHTPIGLLLMTLIICPIFKYNQKKVFSLITTGWVLHLLADLTNKHLVYSPMFLLFPFSWKTYELGILWPEEYLLVLVPLFIIYVGIRLFINLKTKY